MGISAGHEFQGNGIANAKVLRWEHVCLRKSKKVKEEVRDTRTKTG